MKVYIQKKDGEFVDVNAYTSYFGFTELGYEVVSFEKEELESLVLTSETVVHGNISTVLRALDLLDVPRPYLIYIPQELQEFCERGISVTTLGHIRTLQNVPVFIKPLKTRKQFDGHVIREFRDLLYTVEFSDDTEVMTSEYVHFVSEYRVYVLNREIIGCKHYKGNFRLLPDFDILDQAVSQYTSAPIAYAIDFGITDHARTLLIEVNESYALGCYGLNPIKYARMIEARWQQMMQTKA